MSSEENQKNYFGFCYKISKLNELSSPFHPFHPTSLIISVLGTCNRCLIFTPCVVYADFLMASTAAKFFEPTYIFKHWWDFNPCILRERTTLVGLHFFANLNCQRELAN